MCEASYRELCPACGLLIHSAARFCHKCGEPRGKGWGK